MSERRRGKPLSKETCELLSKIRKGKKVPQETKNKISSTLKGYSHSEETKQKIANTLKGKKTSEKHKRNTSIGLQISWKKRKFHALCHAVDEVNYLRDQIGKLITL